MTFNTAKPRTHLATREPSGHNIRKYLIKLLFGTFNFNYCKIDAENNAFGKCLCTFSRVSPGWHDWLLGKAISEAPSEPTAIGTGGSSDITLGRNITTTDKSNDQSMEVTVKQHPEFLFTCRRFSNKFVASDLLFSFKEADVCRHSWATC